MTSVKGLHSGGVAIFVQKTFAESCSAMKTIMLGTYSVGFCFSFLITFLDTVWHLLCKKEIP